MECTVPKEVCENFVLKKRMKIKKELVSDEEDYEDYDEVAIFYQFVC